VWWALRTYAPLVHAPTGGAWTFGLRPSYVAAPATTTTDAPADAIDHLVRRYLEGFGPATPQDVARFSLLRRPVVRDALARLGDELVPRSGPDGGQLVDVPDGLLPDEGTIAPPRLLGMWDSVLLAYEDRTRMVPERYRKVVTRSNGDVLPTVLVDGLVAGVWRPVHDGIEVTAFHRLPAAVWRELAVEAGQLLGLLVARDPSVYRRYARWWVDLPSTEVRVLPP
jgi:hypothetical protein